VRTLITNPLSWVATRARSYTPGSLLGTTVPTGGAASMEPMFTEVVDLGVTSGLPGVGDAQRWTHAGAVKPSFAPMTQGKSALMTQDTSALVKQGNSAEKRDGSGLCPWRPPE
jgi:hypothetical protein